jgi:hypothetical protein
MPPSVARFPNRLPRVGRPHWLLLVLAGLIGVAGYFGPWVPHRAAGLVIIGLDLAEYVKFLPEVISGQIALTRELFYVPLFAASLSAGLLAGRRTLPVLGRALLALAAIPLALAMLPPAWSPTSLRTPEYRLQVLAIAVCLLMLPGILLTRHLPRRLVLVVIALLGLAAALAPVNSFLLVRPAIAAVYNHSLPLGWGFWANLLGFLALSVVAIADVLSLARLG